jgi:ribose-phosphate pyrophosphokinase
MIKIVAGNCSKCLARRLSEHLKLEYVEAQIDRFADEELRVQLKTDFYEQTVFIVQSTSKPANDHLIELLLLVDAVKRSGARRVIALIPYFGYSRQDRPAYEWGPISARLVATLIESTGVDHVITLDLHSKQSEGFFKIGVQNLDPIKLFAEIIQPALNLVIVSPDVGGLIRARKLSEIVGADLAIINKKRRTDNACEMDVMIGNVVNKDCIVIDDIIDTGQTLCKAALLLKAQGAKSLSVVATHAVFSLDAVQMLDAAPIEKIFITDSISQKGLPLKFQIINTVHLFGAAIKKMMLY